MDLLLPLSIAVAALAVSWAALLHRRLRRLRAALPPTLAERILDDPDPVDGTAAVDWRVRGEGPIAAADEEKADPRSEGDDSQVEAALRESEARFRTVIESLGEGLIINDWDGKVLYINERITELTGYTPGELVGKPITGTLIPEEMGSFVSATLEAWRAGKAEEHEIQIRRKDGSRIWTEVHGRPHRNARGRIVGTLSTITDVTARRAAQEALKESEERYRALFEDDVAGNFITSVAGEILACNQAFALIFGFSSVDEAVGSPTLPHSVDAEAREDLLSLVREKRRIEYHEVELRRKDGSPVHVVENVNGIFDENDELTGLQGHLIDVTDRKVLEEQLRQSQKMEAVGRLAGGIAHDFNNLLTAITGYTELLLMDDRTSDSVSHDLQRIQQAANRAATLTNQLLAFSRRQVLQPKVIDLNGVVEGMADMLKRLIVEDVDFRTRLEHGLWMVQADPNQLEQVLMNLVVNARDAMPAGGSLLVATGNIILSEATAARNLELAPGAYVVLEVSDTGEGIAHALQDQIFEPFFTTKEAGKGTGLGLSMAYGLMKQSGGHIAVESEPGKGSTFRIYLPRVEEAAAASDAEPVASGEPGGTETILLVEDEAMVRGLARRVLNRRGYTILESAHPADALAQCREWPGSIHLLLTDIRMPETDGRALAEELLALRPEMKVLFISAYDEAQGAFGPDAVRPASAHGLLPKPFTPVQLARRVRQTLDEERPTAEMAAGPA